MDTHTKSETPRDVILGTPPPPPEKSLLEPLSNHEGKPRSPEKGFSDLRKTAPMLFDPKVREGPPFVCIPRTPQVVLSLLYLHGGGPQEARFWGFPLPVSQLHHIQGLKKKNQRHRV